MELISVRELFKNTEKYADTEIEVGGWVRNRRPSKQFGTVGIWCSDDFVKRLHIHLPGITQALNSDQRQSGIGCHFIIGRFAAQFQSQLAHGTFDPA